MLTRTEAYSSILILKGTSSYRLPPAVVAVWSVRVCDSRQIDRHAHCGRACVACACACVCACGTCACESVGACVPTQVFAGRFDMRTMLAALYPIPPEVPPYFDHSQHDELW